MVKELEITDLETFEIANMIDEEVSALVPSWKDSTSSQIHSFMNYADDEDDDDDNSLHHSFYSSSSFSSSQASLPCLFTSHDTQFYQAKSPHDWLHEDANFHDDASSQSSSCFDNYCYFSADDDGLISSSHKELHCNIKTQKCTRFGPERSMITNFKNFDMVDCTSKGQQKMVRTGSCMDLRSQLLHRTLVEEINKRRLFKTVGAVEHIGYHEPDRFSGAEKRSVFPGKSIREKKDKRRV